VKWFLIEHDFFSGQYNMEFDLKLVNNNLNSSAYLRFYGWKPYCISLGANQSISEIKTDKAFKNNIDIVKRPTGGRAILHAQELTYSVVLPKIKTISGKEVYENISNAIIYGLRLFDDKLKNVDLEKVEPNFGKLLKQSSGLMCFSSTAKNEIKFNGKKLVGSAQRKIGSSLLQHGSILIGNYHRHLVDYLNLKDENEIIKLSNELKNKTIEIETILQKPVNLKHLQNSIIQGFEKFFNIKFHNTSVFSF